MDAAEIVVGEHSITAAAGFNSESNRSPFRFHTLVRHPMLRAKAMGIFTPGQTLFGEW